MRRFFAIISWPCLNTHYIFQQLQTLDFRKTSIVKMSLHHKVLKYSWFQLQHETEETDHITSDTIDLIIDTTFQTPDDIVKFLVILLLQMFSMCFAQNISNIHDTFLGMLCSSFEVLDGHQLWKQLKLPISTLHQNTPFGEYKFASSVLDVFFVQCGNIMIFFLISMIKQKVCTI